jgi:hypothetical protein
MGSSAVPGLKEKERCPTNGSAVVSPQDVLDGVRFCGSQSGCHGLDPVRGMMGPSMNFPESEQKLPERVEVVQSSVQFFSDPGVFVDCADFADVGTAGFEGVEMDDLCERASGSVTSGGAINPPLAASSAYPRSSWSLPSRFSRYLLRLLPTRSPPVAPTATPAATLMTGAETIAPTMPPVAMPIVVPAYVLFAVRPVIFSWNCRRSLFS